MNKIILAAAMCFCLAAAPAAAEVRSVKICDAKTISASTTTDCTYTDISQYKFFSFQVSCTSAAAGISVSADWVGGSAASTTYMGIPLLANGTAMSQLMTTRTTETTYSTLQSIQPPVSPIGTIRLTENIGSADTVCTVILNLGN